MNYVYLIGNGFDLAHGLPTSYYAFLFDYLIRAHGHALDNKRYYDDNLITIENFSYLYYDSLFTSIEAIRDFQKTHPYKFTVKHPFFKNLLSNYENKRWVDIEYEYYLELLKLHGRLETQNERKNQQITKELAALNICFGAIKSALISYLNRIKYNEYPSMPSLEPCFSDIDPKGHSLYLNFNYTNTLRRYVTQSSNVTIMDIHGRLDSHPADVIFGYGDEMDSNYSKIEELNDNEFLKNFKSFGYLRAQYYQRITSFLDKEYHVIIMGHSCGISDRVLLNQIFQNDNCKKIVIYFYERSKSEDDYHEKTMEISRHFDAKNKHLMRNKIQDRLVSRPLVPFSG